MYPATVAINVSYPRDLFKEWQFFLCPEVVIRVICDRRSDMMNVRKCKYFGHHRVLVSKFQIPNIVQSLEHVYFT